MKRVGLLVAVGLMSILGASANAYATPVTLDFDTGSGNVSGYTEEGYLLDLARFVSGNCDSDSFGGSGAPCLALNKNESTTITTSPSGGEFSLTSFWFEIYGGGSGATLRVTSSKGSVDYVLGPGVYDSHDGQVINVIGDIFSGITSLTFSGLVAGNIRIDDIGLAAVPIPAALPLFAGSLGLLGVIGWRKRHRGAVAPSVV